MERGGVASPKLRGQGATEYLVLLAVVLIIALVSIALLGFFPELSSDTKLVQSQTYWEAALPFSVIESKAYNMYSPGYTPPSTGKGAMFYVRIRNTGAYTVRLSAILGDGGFGSTDYWENASVRKSFSNITLAPGEEMCIGHPWIGCGQVGIMIAKPAYVGFYGGAPSVFGANTVCGSDGKGVAAIDNFGFNYIEYVDGVEISKKFIGAKPLMIKCIGTCNSATRACS